MLFLPGGRIVRCPASHAKRIRMDSVRDKSRGGAMAGLRRRWARAERRWNHSMVLAGRRTRRFIGVEAVVPRMHGYRQATRVPMLHVHMNPGEKLFDGLWSRGGCPLMPDRHIVGGLPRFRCIRTRWDNHGSACWRLLVASRRQSGGLAPIWGLRMNRCRCRPRRARSLGSRSLSCLRLPGYPAGALVSGWNPSVIDLKGCLA